MAQATLQRSDNESASCSQQPINAQAADLGNAAPALHALPGLDSTSGLRPSHHDASQPWGHAAGQSSSLPSGPVQHRRATVADLPANTLGTQPGSARQSSGLRAARSLSWSQQAAHTPLLHQHSSGKGLSHLPEDMYVSQESMLYCCLLQKVSDLSVHVVQSLTVQE